MVSRVNHEVLEEFFSTAFYQDFLIFLVPGSPHFDNPAPLPSLRTSIFDPPGRGRNRVQRVHTSVCPRGRLSVECVHPHIPKGLLCLGKGVSVCPVCELVLTPSELLVPPPPSLIASLVLIDGLSHASALAVWSELPPPAR